MKKLISMTDFVLEQFNLLYNANIMQDKYITRTKKYCDFLKQPLELWMFTPCVDNEPFNYSMHGNKEHFEQAKERCLFEGLSLCDDGFIRAEDSYILFSAKSMGKETIEDMIYYNVNLTQTAIKQIGL